MDIHLYNTLTRSKEVFVPLKKGEVGMYHCGPTVYNTPHIGNYRTFVLNDLIRRVFEYNDYKVNQVMNITDVDDKTIRRSREEKVSLDTVTRRYEDLFLREIESLNILQPKKLTRATEYISAMIELISKLLENGTAYKAKDGVYLSIAKVKDYGALAHIHLDKENNNQSRIANDEYDKDNPSDFSLWKFHTEADGEVKWSAPFGDGRPGWHIECSAMAMKELGATIDIHTGGTDLMFPHHTNEIAQSESATHQKYVNYWIHGAFMNVNDEKMAKSKGNFTKLADLVDETISPLSYRYWLMTSHYRSQVNFTFEAVRAAQTALIRLTGIVGNLPEGGQVISSYRERFLTAVNDDLNLAQGLATVWDLLKDSSQSDADKRATILDFDRVLGLKLATAPRIKEESVPPEIQALADAREEARKNKDWKKADALRHEIESRGYLIHDTPGGIKIYAAE